LLMSSIRYFAYGSNMLSQWLRARCKFASVSCVASVSGYRLALSKKSNDGSGKATLVADPVTQVYGVVFDISSDDATELDRIEGRGRGYERIDLVALRHPEGPSISVTAYVAHEDFLESTLQPYDWYRDLIVTGAQQHNLPDDYVATLHAIQALSDPEPTRRTALEARAILDGLEPLR
jgi:gamma-glutamylcyclotransferase